MANSTTKKKLDQVYNVLSKAINIDNDREKYTAIYNDIRNKVIEGLKRDGYFKELYRYEKLCGSYADNLKVWKPNEFDVVLRLEFPKKDKIQIYPDEENKGNVKIDLTNVLTELRRDINKENQMLMFLNKMVDKDCLLLENKFQQWMHSLMAKLLNCMTSPFIYYDEEYKLLYHKQGPAHTVKVHNLKEDKPMISIDFVPGFIFSTDLSVSSRVPLTEFWEAIPRPLKFNKKLDNPSFRTSYVDSERIIINNKKYQLKNALRLVKKFRDHRPKMVHLKSYYIKTLFLWLDEERGSSFWQNSIDVIMQEVFKRLEEALLDKQIKYFWHSDLNLLHHFRPTQIEEMQREVRRARKILLTSDKKDIFNLFLSPEEQTKVTETDMKIIADSMQISSLNLINLFFWFCLFCLCVTYLVKFLYV